MDGEGAIVFRGSMGDRILFSGHSGVHLHASAVEGISQLFRRTREGFSRRGNRGGWGELDVARLGRILTAALHFPFQLAPVLVLVRIVERQELSEKGTEENVELTTFWKQKHIAAPIWRNTLSPPSIASRLRVANLLPSDLVAART